MTNPTLCYFNGKFIPLDDAKISIRTHAMQYGTGCFAALRGYWNESEKQLFIAHIRDHFERLHRSSRILLIRLPLSVDELIETTLDLVRHNNDRQDVYIRAVAFKDTLETGPRLHDVPDGLAIYAVRGGPRTKAAAGNGFRCCVSSWRRIDDNSIPARAKVTGSYMNSALARTEAQLNGFDDAIMLTRDGHVSEGSVQNIFLLSNNVLYTPAASESILIGITRKAIMSMVQEEFGVQVVERQLDRTELYVAEEVFLCGTGGEIVGVREIDHRPVGDGKVGAFTRKVQAAYFAAVRGQTRKYRKWCTPVYESSAVAVEA